jgi:hypothetical protein
MADSGRVEIKPDFIPERNEERLSVQSSTTLILTFSTNGF